MIHVVIITFKHDYEHNILIIVVVSLVHPSLVH